MADREAIEALLARTIWERVRVSLVMSGEITWGQVASDLLAALDAAGLKLVEPGHVAMPTSADEAAMMHLLGLAWLEQNAPERLAAHNPEPSR